MIPRQRRVRIHRASDAIHFGVRRRETKSSKCLATARCCRRFGSRGSCRLCPTLHEDSRGPTFKVDVLPHNIAVCARTARLRSRNCKHAKTNDPCHMPTESRHREYRSTLLVWYYGLLYHATGHGGRLVLRLCWLQLLDLARPTHPSRCSAHLSGLKGWDSLPETPWQAADDVS